MSLADIFTAVTVLAGALFSALGALGLLRFPDLLTRLHAATKPQTVGLLLILAGAAAQAEGVAEVASLLLVALFQIATSPVIAQTIGVAGHRAGVIDRRTLIADERPPPGSG